MQGFKMESNCLCVEPYELSEVISVTTQRTRKRRMCGECREPIEAGTRYERAVIKSEAGVSTEITCLTCKTIRDEMFTCGWYYGEIWAWIHQCKCLAEEDGFCMCPPRAPKSSRML